MQSQLRGRGLRSKPFKFMMFQIELMFKLQLKRERAVTYSHMYFCFQFWAKTASKQCDFGKACRQWNHFQSGFSSSKGPIFSNIKFLLNTLISFTLQTLSNYKSENTNLGPAHWPPEQLGLHLEFLFASVTYEKVIKGQNDITVPQDWCRFEYQIHSRRK